MKLSMTFLLLGMLAGPALAEIERHHGAHVHGEATGNLSLDGQRLRLELAIPGFNLVGFEHPPRDERQQAGLDAAMAWLAQGEWLQTDRRGECGVVELDVHGHGFEASGEHRSEHHRHQEHAHGPDHDHAEFHIVAQLDCARPAGLRWLEIGLFEAFPGNEQIVVDVLTETLATRARLVPGRERIELDRPARR